MKRWLALLPIVVLVALGVFLMTQMDRMAGDPAAGPTYRPDALVGQQGIAVVGVAYKDDPVATDAFLDELGDPYRLVLVDREGRAGLDLGVSGVPESFAVDAYGTIVAKSSGPILTDADLKTLTDALNAPAR